MCFAKTAFRFPCEDDTAPDPSGTFEQMCSGALEKKPISSWIQPVITIHDDTLFHMNV